MNNLLQFLETAIICKTIISILKELSKIIQLVK